MINRYLSIDADTMILHFSKAEIKIIVTYYFSFFRSHSMSLLFFPPFLSSSFALLSCVRNCTVSKGQGEGWSEFQRYDVEMYVHPLSRLHEYHECFVENFHLRQRIQLRGIFRVFLFFLLRSTTMIPTQFIDCNREPNHFPRTTDIGRQ